MKGSVRERLHQRVMVYLQVFRDNPHYHRLIIDSVHRGDSPNGQAILKLLRHSVDELEELLREGVASGELKPLDARMLQLAIAAMCEFFFSARPVFQAVFGAETDDPEFVERYSHFMTDLISDSRQRTPMRDTRQRPLLRRLK
jgi:AcrR family transcriptional regulator